MHPDFYKKQPGILWNSNGSAEILLWAPNAEKAQCLLCKQHNIIELQKENYGYWRTITDSVQPGDTYKFIVDGKQLPDPASLHQPDGVHGPSQVIDLSNFKWNDSGWENLPLSNYIFYEIHTGTFSTEGTFAGIEAKLDHLLSLGITAIEIMPVAEFPGRRNWGYDGVYPYAVHAEYGGAEGLMKLVNACHKKGLAVVLDVVYNHVGPEGNYLGVYGPYFTGKYNTPWGDAVNYDDAWCDGVRNFVVQNALMWFRDFHIDALRLDAVHAIKDFSPVHILQEIRQELDKLMNATGRTHYLIVECDLNDTRFINPREQGGYAMDGQWMDEFHHALRVTAGNERNGYYADFEGIKHLAKSYNDVYVYDGIYSPHRSKIFGTKATGKPGDQFTVFSQNHDQVGNRMLGERTGTLVSFEMRKLMAAAVMVSPFLPLLFMGEEWSETNPFLYFVSHTDPGLIEAVRKGRKAEFAAFNADGEAPDPQAEETFERSKLQWDLLKQQQHAAMFNYYKALISLRKSVPDLHNPDRKDVLATTDEQHNLLTLRRGKTICLMNFSKHQQQVIITTDGHKLFDSAAPEWLGPAAAPQNITAGSALLLQSESIVIYTSNHV